MDSVNSLSAKSESCWDASGDNASMALAASFMACSNDLKLSSCLLSRDASVARFSSLDSSSIIASCSSANFSSLFTTSSIFCSASASSNISINRSSCSSKAAKSNSKSSRASNIFWGSISSMASCSFSIAANISGVMISSNNS